MLHSNQCIVAAKKLYQAIITPTRQYNTKWTTPSLWKHTTKAYLGTMQGMIWSYQFHRSLLGDSSNHPLEADKNPAHENHRMRVKLSFSFYCYVRKPRKMITVHRLPS